MEVDGCRRICDPHLGGLVQQQKTLWTYRTYPSGRSRGQLLCSAEGNRYRCITPTKLPPGLPGRFNAPGHNGKRPELQDLSNDDLVDAVRNPADGQKVKVRGNEVRDGNGRIKEMKDRGFPPETEIPVEELPDEPIAPWEN